MVVAINTSHGDMMGHHRVAIWTHVESRHTAEARVSWHCEGRYSHVVAVDIVSLVSSRDRSSSQFTCGTSNEHNIVTRWVQCPVVAFAGSS